METVEKSCTQCSYTTHSDIVLRAHVTAKHSSIGGACLQCPLCSDKLQTMDALEKHLFTTHNVNEEGVKKLMSTVDMSARRKNTRDEGIVFTLLPNLTVISYFSFITKCLAQQFWHCSYKVRDYVLRTKGWTTLYYKRWTTLRYLITAYIALCLCQNYVLDFCFFCRSGRDLPMSDMHQDIYWLWWTVPASKRAR